MPTNPRVLVVADHASLRFGGEAALPLHFFMGLRRKGVECWMIVHARTRPELQERLGPDISRVVFVEDDWFHKLMWRSGRFLPAKLAYHSAGFLSRLHTQLTARRKAKDLIKRVGIDIVHQPIPVSPKEPSLMAGLGVPVVIGPMNGHMTYPPGLGDGSGRRSVFRGILDGFRMLSDLLHHLMPGKKHAALLLVANERTRRGLPPIARGEIRELVENGIDPDLWLPPHETHLRQADSLNVVFMGRLVDWKRVDLAIKALAALPHLPEVRLTIIGDGPERAKLELLAKTTGTVNRITFAGWREQSEAARMLAKADCLILPSVFECGGAVILEAMAIGHPVIATAWGGPLDYITPETGLLVEPTSEHALIAGFAAAMERLARDPALAQQLGEAGRQRVLDHFTWPSKIDAILLHYRNVLRWGG
ncbi:glycosyltransferase family 4 protein [Fuscovulum ytuae]|uniref:Glycosyltransferase family 4 protein n=1 Tax=Fuscovulum ytuae TaxID=3042299 RepID=A0ABY8Q4X1_9RHOB|nr:glycosyltransferase family 4 protein [Fuscovulum sp. YMD61]WGV15923.1 glycosyltransferase family 4 protein [Fuscovulum sp. YMD61]